MTEIELAWLAGLLEGEGSFVWSVSGTPVVSLIMTDRDVVVRAAQLMGGVRCGGPYTDVRPERKLKYRATAYGDIARFIMVSILPFMGDRRRQRIMEVLEHHDISLNARRERHKAATEGLRGRQNANRQRRRWASKAKPAVRMLTVGSPAIV